MKVTVLAKATMLSAAMCLVVLANHAGAVTLTIPVGLTWGGDGDNLTDDAEEKLYASGLGEVGTGSSDIEIGQDDAAAEPHLTGFRYLDIPIPPGAPITSASIQFTADEPDKNTNPANFVIYGEASLNPVTFSGLNMFDISSRPKTEESVDWHPAPWLATGDSGPAQQTSDLTAIVQELVNQTGWTAGNAMVFMIYPTALDGTEANRTSEPADFGGGEPPAVNPDRSVLTINYIPEPSSIAILGIGALATLLVGTRRRSA